MPNCFSLTRRSALEAGPVVLQQIDDEMRAHFGAPEDPNHWLNGWYDYIGFSLAMGKSPEWLQQDIDGEILSAKDESTLKFWSEMRDIHGWLFTNFTHDAWAEIGRM